MTQAETRLQRALIIKDAILAAAKTVGRWESDEFNGVKVPYQKVDAGLGWEARLTPASLHPRNIIDLWASSVGIKVLSLECDDDWQLITLRSLQPGPWEAMFGLPSRQWTASLRKRNEIGTA